MQKHIYKLFIPVLLLVTGCIKDSITESYTFYRPVYKTREEVKANIKLATPTEIVQPGKIVWKDQFLYLNEFNKGIHVIDISNPASPVNKYYIEIPGCVDLAVNGNYLYADCYTDLVTLDINNPAGVKLVKVIESVFPHRYYNGFLADTSKVILKWVKVDTTITSSFKRYLNHPNNNAMMMQTGNTFLAINDASSKAAYGTAGSLARFALQNNRLYTVSYTDLKLFNIQQAASPLYIRSIQFPMGNIETIFPYKQQLFIGSQSGMFIYNTTDPDNPTKLGQFVHSRSCDPVIADDNYAYVTLWGGSFCGGFSNQLDVIDISNLSAPSLVKTYPLSGPKGLSKDGNLLLICDGKDGVRIMDATVAGNIKQIAVVTGFTGNDIIAQNGIAVVTAEDGLYIIDYSSPQNPKQRSFIQVSKY